VTIDGSMDQTDVMVSIRSTCESDVDEIARIYIDSWNEGFGHLTRFRSTTPDVIERWRGHLRDPSVTWSVAEIDSVIVGFTGVGACRDPVDPNIGELQTIAVDPPSWRRGIGRLLMRDALDRLGSSYTSAVLWTVADYERGHAFHRAIGWVPLGWHRADDTEVAFGHRLEGADDDSVPSDG
jgi:ribosomal protein S18 acetylase RimI-like enzyme